MSVTKSNPVAAKKTSSKKPPAAAVSAAANHELVSLLENTEIGYASYNSLFIGSLNVRIIPHTPEEVQEYADSIAPPRATGCFTRNFVCFRDAGEGSRMACRRVPVGQNLHALSHR